MFDSKKFEEKKIERKIKKFKLKIYFYFVLQTYFTYFKYFI